MTSQVQNKDFYYRILAAVERDPRYKKILKQYAEQQLIDALIPHIAEMNSILNALTNKENNCLC